MSYRSTQLVSGIRIPFIKVPLPAFGRSFRNCSSCLTSLLPLPSSWRWQWQRAWLGEVTAWAMCLNTELLARGSLCRIRKLLVVQVFFLDKWYLPLCLFVCWTLAFQGGLFICFLQFYSWEKKFLLVERQIKVLVNAQLSSPVQQNTQGKTVFFMGIIVEQQWRMNLLKPKALEGLSLGERTKSELQIEINGNTRISDKWKIMFFS